MSGNSTKLSVITVCFNAVSTLEQTMLSVFDQDFKNIEYIIIDGGSDDGTVDLIKKHESRIASWISEPDAGIYDAMNKGVDRATGHWVYFLGSGDILLNVLKDIVPKLMNTHYIYYGDVYRKDLGRIYGGKYSGFKLAVTNICHQAIFYPLSVLKKYRYDIQYKMLADHHLNMQCYGDKTYKLQYLPLQISIYEGNGVSASIPDTAFYRDKINLVKKNFSLMIFLYVYVRRTIAQILKRR